MPVDENNEASSTSSQSDAAVAAHDFARFEKIENARSAGKPIPDAPAPSKEPSETAAGSEPANKDIQEKPNPKTEARFKELLDARVELENKVTRLEAELKGKAPGEKVVDPPPAGKKPAEPKKAEEPVEPQLADFATFAEFQAADRKYTREMVQFETNKVLAADRAQQATSTANREIETSLNTAQVEARAEFADFDEVALAKSTPITGVMDAWILKNLPVSMKVLYRLGENSAAEAKRISALDHFDQIDALAEIRASFKTAKKDAAPPVKKHSAAPPPATDIAARNLGAADEADAAVAAKDFSAYERIMNARAAKLAA